MLLDKRDVFLELQRLIRNFYYYCNNGEQKTATEREQKSCKNQSLYRLTERILRCT